jgi:hypothetical protein
MNNYMWENWRHKEVDKVLHNNLPRPNYEEVENMNGHITSK